MKPLPRFLAVAVLVAACSSDSFTPTTENVMGTYAARTFTTTDAAGTIDWLARGSTMDLPLGPSGTVIGHILIPGGGSGGLDLDQILLGDWTLTGSTITFDMPAVDTFVRDMPWSASKNALTGDHTFSGLRIRVVLTK